MFHDHHLHWAPIMARTKIIIHPSILFWRSMVVYMPSRYIYKVRPSPTPSFSTNMTIVSNDPTVWPVVNSYRISSYFAGSWRAHVEANVASKHWLWFAVAASVGVTYDWGEHDKTKELSTSYNHFQHLHSDKRYVYAMTGSAILLRMVS